MRNWNALFDYFMSSAEDADDSGVQISCKGWGLNITPVMVNYCHLDVSPENHFDSDSD